jgi:hypothetical protein
MPVPQAEPSVLAVGQIRARAQRLAGSLLGGAAGTRLHAIGVLADAGTVEDRAKQSVQAGEGEIGLRLDTRRRQQLHST